MEGIGKLLKSLASININVLKFLKIDDFEYDLFGKEVLKLFWEKNYCPGCGKPLIAQEKIRGCCSACLLKPKALTNRYSGFCTQCGQQYFKGLFDQGICNKCYWDAQAKLFIAYLFWKNFF